MPKKNHPEYLPCGCRICGCACTEHSLSGERELCAAHVNGAVFRFIAGEAAALLSLALFVGMAGIWAVIFSQQD
jgi:hypothetical protein